MQRRGAIAHGIGEWQQKTALLAEFRGRREQAEMLVRGDYVKQK
jgi:hypothetical protein